jgi:hypothetical protein
LCDGGESPRITGEKMYKVKDKNGLKFYQGANLIDLKCGDEFDINHYQDIVIYEKGFVSSGRIEPVKQSGLKSDNKKLSSSEKKSPKKGDK